jgi:uncharacterized protein
MTLPIFSADTFAHSLELFILQPTTFCNINCDYCYLPDRNSYRSMPETILTKAFERLFQSVFVSDSFTVVWHAGEPLVVPISFYELAVQRIQELSLSNHTITHNIQTNATLLTDDWCRFLKKNRFRIGVSLDGPEILHDRHRKMRSGKGTFCDVINGIRLLQDYAIDFHVICVLTRDSLEYADEIFWFFRDLGVKRVGFNVEESEGFNTISSLAPANIEPNLRRFVQRLFELWMEFDKKPQIREFQGLLGSITTWTDDEDKLRQDSYPFRIINIDVDGNFSTFSPELHGYHTNYGDFWFGNVLTDSFDVCIKTEKFRRIYNDILQGIHLCKKNCQYFCLCRGGSPSNKYFENGSFVSTETRHCKNTKQVFIDEVFRAMETRFNLP